MFVYTLNFIDRTLIAVVAQPIIDSFSLSDTQWGLLYGPPFALFYALMGIPIAMWADRSNRVMIISLCIVVWSVMTALCGVAAGFLTLLAFRVGVAIGEAGCTPPANSLISDYYPPIKRATALSVYSMGITIGAMLANIFGGPIAEMQGADVGAWIASMGLTSLAAYFNWEEIEGWRIAFVVIGLPGVLVAALVMMSIREPVRGGMDGEVAPIASDERLGFNAVLKMLFDKPSFWWAAIAVSLVAFVGYGIAAFQAPFLQREHGLSVREAALQFGAPLAGFSALGTFLGGIVTQRLLSISPKAIIWVPAVALALSVPCYVLAFFSESLTNVLIFWALGAMLHYSYIGSQYNIAQGVVSARARATSVALLLLMVSIIGNGIGPYFVGYLSDLFMQMELGSRITVEACNSAQGLSAELSALCARGNSAGLKNSISVTACLFFVSSFCFFMAGRTLQRDFVAKL